jgi:outer membrane receptor protein involved in Fe transport
MKYKSRITQVVGVALLSGAATAPAQESAGVSVLEEVVVTARKRVESIQDAPLTIQAFTEEQIEERGVHVYRRSVEVRAGPDVQPGLVSRRERLSRSAA